MALALADLPGGHLAAVTGDEDGSVHVWDLSRGEMRWSQSATRGGVMALASAALPDGRPVVAFSREEPLVHVADLHSGEPIGEPLPSPDTVRTLAVHRSTPPSLVIGGAGIAVADLLGDAL